MSRKSEKEKQLADLVLRAYNSNNPDLVRAAVEIVIGEIDEHIYDLEDEDADVLIADLQQAIEDSGTIV